MSSRIAMLRGKYGDWRCSQETVLLKQILLIDTWSLPESMARRWARGWHVQVTLRAKIVPIELIYITTRRRLSLLLHSSSRCSSFFVWWNVEYGSDVCLVACQNMLIFPPLCLQQSIPEMKIFSPSSWNDVFYSFFLLLPHDSSLGCAVWWCDD